MKDLHRHMAPHHAVEVSSAWAQSDDRREYHCVYCRKRVQLLHLSAHEAHCDDRELMQRMWAMQIEKARREER